MSGYVYQPEQRVKYKPAVSTLRERYGAVVEYGVDATAPRALEQIHQGFVHMGIAVKQLSVDSEQFAAYLETAEYAPSYYPDNLSEKALEHFVALSLLGLSGNDTLIDIASEGSPLPEIAARLTGCAAYAQDIMYPRGINGCKIGGDACAMPLPDASVSGVTLTCSLEHFEGDADVRLFRELHRILVPEGRVVIVPLYMWTEACVLTDPCVSAAVDVPFDAGATIHCVEGWNNRHGRFYSPQTLRERLLGNTGFRFTVLRLLGTERLKAVYARWALLAERRS